MISVKDFITTDDLQSFMPQEVVVDETGFEEQEDRRNQLRWSRLRNHNDDYDEILVNTGKKIVVRNGEIVLAVPKPHEIVAVDLRQ